ncbi:MAG: glycosyltransferase family 39 protein [Tepidisphaeraceae bacterium]
MPRADSQPEPPPAALRWTDYLLLVAVCVPLFGYVAISGRPMTMHEARLPQCSREMLASGNWLIPMNGSRPWLERPPLPHWIMIAFAKAMGQHCDNEWSVRIPPAAMGLLIVLMTAAMAARWLGRGMGLVCGFAAASMYEFYYYCTLAEDDIFLAALVVGAIALFVRMEFFADPQLADRRLGFFAWRPWPVVAFFALLGLMNLAKGPLVGAILVLAVTGAFLLWQSDWQRMRRYVWLWGWLGAVILALAWHVLAYRRFPGYWDNLRYDFHESRLFDEPWWYYGPQILGVALPWSPAALVGLWIAARSAWRDRSRPHRFLLCWAIVPIVILSIPHRKHHHYLLPCLPAWGMLAAMGLRPIVQQMFSGPPWSRRPRVGLLVFGLPVAVLLIALLWLHKIPGPPAMSATLIVIWLACVWAFYYGLCTRRAGWLLAAILAGVGVAYDWGQTYLPNDTVPDTQFLRQADAMVPRDKLLAINGAVGPLDFFRVQFYLRENALLLHNLSYLRSNQVHEPELYLIGRKYDLPALKEVGDAKVLLESAHSRRQKKPNQQLALFHLVFKPGLTRYPPPPVSPMQAMERAPGPDCGPPLPEPGSPPDS